VDRRLRRRDSRHGQHGGHDLPGESLSEGTAQLGGIGPALAFAGVLALANSSLGLIAIALVDEAPLAGALLLIPVGVLYGAYRPT